MAKDIQLPVETFLRQSMDEVLHNSMMPYAEHVILERALPRVEDGLKPVQRRILYTMMELGLTPDKPHRKSARIVGDCLGKYHPHGDSSVYDAMVRMAQGFNMRVPLVDPNGNFGSMDGDSAAAMRYTEARMTTAALQQLEDIHKDTVDFTLNFDDTLKEPELLPGRFPNLLVNGASGIAVGLATNIPPHNPGEAIDAVIAVMENPKIPLDDLMKIIPAPDFPTGGFLLESDELRKAYAEGRGKLVMRANTHFEEQKNGKTLIVITEFPYGCNKASLLEKILSVSQEKKDIFQGIGDIRDESDRNGVRAVIEVKKDANPEKILQNLFRYTDLQCTFGVNMVAIAEGKPQQMGLIKLIRYYIKHQRDVVTRRTKFDLEKAKADEHIYAGYMLAIANLDRVIALIRGSKSPKEAKAALIREIGFTELQAEKILELQLQRLTNLELETLQKKYKEILRRIAELEGILASDTKLRALIRKELLEIKATMDCARRTHLIPNEALPAAEEEEKAPAEDVVVAVLKDMKVRRCPARLFQQAQIAEEHPLFVIPTKTDRKLVIFTDTGSVLNLSVGEIPETRPTAKAVNLLSLLSFEKNEQILNVFEEGAEGEYLFFTAGGMVKRTAAAEYCLRVKRTAALTLKDGDRLFAVEKLTGDSVLQVTRLGMSIRFAADTLPATGRISGGVKCMKLDPGDEVVFAAQPSDEGELLLITDRGFAKRSFLFEYEIQGRNGKGLKTFDFKRNGSNGNGIAAAFYVKDPFDIAVEQRHGTVTVINTESVHLEDRFSRGSMVIAVLLDDDVIRAERRTDK